MPIVTGYYTLDRSKLPAKADELRFRFVPQFVNGKNTLLVIYPDSEPSFEPSYIRYVVGMKLLLDDGTAAQMLGQIVVTRQRILGMITDGSVNKAVLDESADSVDTFDLDLDDTCPVEIKKNRRGKSVEALIQSKVDQSPVFGIKVFSAGPGLFLLLKDDGQVTRTPLSAFLE